MSSVKELHFVALVPPEPLKSELQDLRLLFKEKYNSAHALKSPPHITLLSPFRLEKGKSEELNNILTERADQQKPFEVQLRDFDHFGKRVVFVDVEQSKALMQVQETLEEAARSKPGVFNYNYDERPYHPHLTLAFKDLSIKNFHKAWDEFKDRELKASFTADRFVLLQHDGKQWQVKKEYPF